VCGGHTEKPPGRGYEQPRQQRQIVEKENHALRILPSSGLTLK
jgi:hypothetical protein